MENEKYKKLYEKKNMISVMMHFVNEQKDSMPINSNRLEFVSIEIDQIRKMNDLDQMK